MKKLKAKSRKVFGRKNKQIREEKDLPAVIYGHDFKSQPIKVNQAEFEKVLKESGKTSLIDLEIDDQKPVKVLIHDLQHDLLTNKVQHVDFYKIKAGEKITVDVQFNFVGEAPTVKEQGGVLVPVLNNVEVECLPENLINEIDIDLSVFKTFDDVIRVKDLKVPEGVNILADPEELVVQVERPKTEEELEAELAEEKEEEIPAEEKEPEEEGRVKVKEEPEEEQGQEKKSDENEQKEEK